MIATLQQIMEKSIERLAVTAMTYLPPLVAGLIILGIAWVAAVAVRWAITRIFKGAGVDRFLHQSGLSSMLDRSGRLRATRIVSGGAFWLIIGTGALTGLSAFNTEMTNSMIQSVLFLMPKLLTAGVILLAGAWLGQYLGRSMLLWAYSEEMPSPQVLAACVRGVVVFVAVVVASDHLNFARSVFLTAFGALLAGGVIALSIALGFHARDLLRRRGAPQRETEDSGERSLWSHL
jgi:hypothetical protein